jgi:outer membrane lipoprotein SlyB
MTSMRIIPAIVLLALTPACVATTTTTAEWGELGYENVRYGQVAWVQEVVQHEHGDPVGGAIAGAIIGGILTGGRGPGALVGAAVGASASHGHSVTRFYDITVRFDDGSQQVFRYLDYAPFRPGDNVAQTPQGLSRT